MNNQKLRVWWIPQVGIEETFHIPVSSPEEGKKFLDVLAAYDLFQLQNKVRPGFCNTGGLEIFDEEEQDWCDWWIETEDTFYEDIDDYCTSEEHPNREELSKFSMELFMQIDASKF